MTGTSNIKFNSINDIWEIYERVRMHLIKPTSCAFEQQQNGAQLRKWAA